MSLPTLKVICLCSQLHSKNIAKEKQRNMKLKLHAVEGLEIVHSCNER